jgi:ABC-2 type transport system permease protein
VTVNGVIHDIGYQRYEGPRLGRGYAWRSLYQHSLRTAFGLGRGAKAKLVPWTPAAIILLVAVVLTVVRAGFGEMPVSYPEFSDSVSVLSVLFAALVAPELVSRDLRGGVLPLYFSRPLRRSDYALAKLAALLTATWLILAGPLTLMYVGGVFSVDGWRAVWDETRDFGGGLLFAGVHAVVIGTIALLVASLFGRRAVAAGAIVAVFLATLPVVGVVEVVAPARENLAGVFSPGTLLFGLGGYVFGTDDYPDPYGPAYVVVAVTLVAACVALLLLRYRRVHR